MGEMICPVCKRERGIEVRMIYDPETDEYYCPVCGYSIDAKTPNLPIFSEDNLQFSLSNYVDSDKGLGGKMDPGEIQNVLRSVGKKNISRKKAMIFQVSNDLKVFKENKRRLQLIINCIQNEYDVRIPDYIYNDTIYYTSKIMNRSYKSERFYNTLEVFLAVLYHVMIMNFLQFHKTEILEMISDCGEMYAPDDMSKNVLKRVITRRHSRILNKLPHNKVKVTDKIRAVSERYGVPYELSEMLFKYLLKKIDILSKYDVDNVIFAGVYFIRENIMGEKIDKEDKILKSGIRSLYTVINSTVPSYVIDRLKNLAMKYKKEKKLL